MAITGSITTMSLTDLLRWAHGNRKSGSLELERNKIRKQIQFEQGRIVSCSTQDPNLLLGQFLISRGKITPAQLQEALAWQERTGQTLGVILSEMNLLTPEDLAREVRAKAEESLLGLFDWSDAVFRFNELATIEGYGIAIDLEIEEIIRMGTQRHQELERIRRVLGSSAIVLMRTERQTPPEIQTSGMASQILDSIDGQRSIAEILLHAHASEYLVIRFLFMLLQRGVVMILEDCLGPVGNTILDPPPTDAPAEIEAEIKAEVEAEVEESEVWEPETCDESDEVETEYSNDIERSNEIDIQVATPEEMLAAEESPAPTSTPTPTATSTPTPSETQYPDLASSIRLFEQLSERGEHDAALEIIGECYRRHPGDGYLRHLELQAEGKYLEQMRSGELNPSKIPTRVKDVDIADETLDPSESFLLGSLDAGNNIQSILWTAPLREVDLFRALQQLQRKGLIEMRDAAPGANGEQVAQVLWA